MEKMAPPFRFEDEPAKFLVQNIKEFVLQSPENCLKDIDGSPIFEEPLIGFADGDDPLFLKYKEIGVIGDFHFTPREAIEKHVREELNTELRFDDVSVISWVLPFSKTVRISNRKMIDGPSLEWNHGRWHGEALNERLARYVVSLLQARSYAALAPGKSSFFRSVLLNNGLASVWSERHIAYAAGLGTFSLTDALITQKGLAMRCGSVVANIKVTPSPRPYATHTENCCFLAKGTCGLCARRCPAGAITARGHDKVRCREHVIAAQAPWLKKEGYIGRYAGCGLCMTGVPCEARVPAEVHRRFIP